VAPAIVVLKFGSSVLQTAAALPLAIEEIYREWRAHRRVIAVVSAFAGVTDRRFAEARLTTDDPWQQAAWVADGERECGSQLAAALTRHGISARYVDEREAELIAQGEPHESTPISLNTQRLRECLGDHAVLVFPGFIARDDAGRCVLLGRGGSDLTALFLARNLDAQCRLLKDVDGVYDRDPALGGNHAHRFQRVSWRRALDIGGKLIQPRALQLAQAHNQAFEVAGVGTNLATRIDHGPDVLATIAQQPRRPIRVVLLGLGTVGLGVYTHLARRPELFEVVRIVVRDVDKPRVAEGAHVDVPKDLLATDLLAAITQPAELVIETVGGAGTIGEVVHAALSRGRAVVTANKALLTSHWWDKLARFATGAVPLLRFSAAAGGAVPVLETVAELARHAGIVRVRAVLNGTCNFILDALERGTSFAAAIADAQACGFAEADPRDDLMGLDAARKLELIARAAFGANCHFEANVHGILGVTGSQAVLARQRNRNLRLVAACECDGAYVRGSVDLQELPAGDFLAAARAEENRVEIVTRTTAAVRLAGKGAGRWPTALSVLSDVHDYLRHSQSSIRNIRFMDAATDTRPGHAHEGVPERESACIPIGLASHAAGGGVQ
jgi:homoserine dehydrogenase